MLVYGLTDVNGIFQFYFRNSTDACLIYCVEEIVNYIFKTLSMHSNHHALCSFRIILFTNIYFANIPKHYKKQNTFEKNVCIVTKARNQANKQLSHARVHYAIQNTAASTVSIHIPCSLQMPLLAKTETHCRVSE